MLCSYGRGRPLPEPKVQYPPSKGVFRLEGGSFALDVAYACPLFILAPRHDYKWKEKIRKNTKGKEREVKKREKTRSLGTNWTN